MRVWKMAGATAAIVAAVGVGAALAPVAQGQGRIESWGDVDGVLQAVTVGGSHIGASIRDVTDDDVTRAKLPGLSGVVIEDVREDSPAENAGFRKGDIVVEFDGERVRSARQFTRLVQETPADRQVQAVVVRDAERVNLSVQPRTRDVLGYVRDRTGVFARPAPPAPPAPPRPAPAPRVEVLPHLEQFFGTSGRLGIRVDSLSEQLAEYFGTKNGVLVTSVTDNSAAAQAGLKAGDVITGINGTSVSSLGEWSREVRRLEEGEQFTLEVVRDRQPLTLKGKVEPRQPRRWTMQTVV